MTTAKPTYDLRALRAAGASYAEIAALTGLSKSQIAWRLRDASSPRVQRGRGSISRPCMCCGKRFFSEGAHNRLCAACGARGSSPFDTIATFHF